jgi:inner membrane protein
MEEAIIWLVTSVVLMLLEIVIPGGVVIFLGIAAGIVAASVGLGLVDTIWHSLILWFISSVVLLLGLRSFFMRYFEGDSTVQNVSEEDDYLSSVVEVVEEIHPYREGRVSFRGVTWQARSEENLPLGSSAVIRGRDGNTWIVKSL